MSSIYQKLFHKSFNEKLDKLYEPIALVTGANKGIGFETVKGILRVCPRATVVLTTRDMERGQQAKQEIVSALLALDPREYTSVADRLLVRQLDLASFASVRKFAQEMRSELRRLDILVLNAGIVPPRQRELTADGLEKTMATNHFGHFLLALELLPLLRAPATQGAAANERSGRHSRVVVVSSVGHNRYKAKQLLENYNLEKPDSYNEMSAYCGSKLANVMFAVEFSRRLQAAGERITVNSLHPGWVDTDMLHKDTFLSKLVYWFSRTLTAPALRSIESGAQCSLYCALSSKLEGVTGHYFDNCSDTQPNSDALNVDAARTFWQISEQRTGSRYPA